MPILDLEIVGASDDATAVSAQPFADAAAAVFGSPPGRTWVRLRRLDRACYAENGCTLADDELPVFVTVLHAHPPAGGALGAEVRALTQAIAAASGRPAERVHVQYAPPAAGRQAFGGRLVE
jgi:hypothetical protein